MLTEKKRRVRRRWLWKSLSLHILEVLRDQCPSVLRLYRGCTEAVAVEGGAAAAARGAFLTLLSPYFRGGSSWDLQLWSCQLAIRSQSGWLLMRRTVSQKFDCFHFTRVFFKQWTRFWELLLLENTRARVDTSAGVTYTTKVSLYTLFEIFIFCPKNQLWFPEKIVNFFWWWKTRENVVVLDFLAVDNFDFTRKIVNYFLDEKLVKMLWFWTF